MQHTGQHLLERWNLRPEKRILALDGGGVRGVLTLQFLAQMEADLKRRSGGKIQRLSDYFDLVAGTSTGAIIASAIASGWQIADLQEAYRSLAKKAFKHQWLGWLSLGALVPKFSTKSLQQELQSRFDVELGSESVHTGLMIVARRVDTASPWFIHNHPDGPYYNSPEGSGWIANSKFKLWDLVLASAAAPTYFKPRRITVGYHPDGTPETGLFIDGGLSPHNNPALQALRTATLHGYGFRWPLGADKLSLVSVGTGSRANRIHKGGILSVLFAIKTLKSLMDDCASEVELTLQWLSDSQGGRQIDSEVGDLSKDSIGGQSWLRYTRYNVELETLWLKNQLNLDRTDSQLKALHEMDRYKNVGQLDDLGEIAAKQLVRSEHLPLTEAEMGSE